MLIYEAVISNAAIKMNKRWTKGRQETFFAIIADLFQVDEVCTDDGGVHWIVIA